MKILAGKWKEEAAVNLKVNENGSVKVEVDAGCQTCKFLGRK
jgi:hypothetical protein